MKELILKSKAKILIFNTSNEHIMLKSQLNRKIVLDIIYN